MDLWNGGRRVNGSVFGTVPAYREVTNLVVDRGRFLTDEDGRATRLAVDLHERLERLGVYEPEKRPWLPHVTVLRFRRPPRLRPALPDLGRFMVTAAAHSFQPAPVRATLVRTLQDAWPG